MRRQRIVEHPEQPALEVGGQASIDPHRLEVDRDPDPSPAIPRGPPQRWHEAEVVEDHRADVEDEGLRGVEGPLDHRDERVDLGAGLRGALLSNRSTIWAWRTMLVRLCAGPSCIWRAISRRMSSWAVRIIRETPGGTGAPCSTLRSSGIPSAASSPVLAVLRAPAGVPAIAGPTRRGPRRLGQAGADRRLPSRRSIWASMRAALRAIVTSWLASSVSPSACAGAGGEALGGHQQLLGGRLAARLVAGGLGPGLIDEELDLLDLRPDHGSLLLEAHGETRRRRW